MAKVILAKQARHDLLGIKRYTVKRWSEEQSRKYIDHIYDYANRIAIRNLKGTERGELAPDLKSYHIGRHIIFYVDTEEGIAISRILHDSMDFPKHF